MADGTAVKKDLRANRPLVVGDAIIKLLEIKGGTVKLQIEGPEDMEITRVENPDK